ncbi:hypothetical protein IRJ41_021707 [Triplophysa rosa]|uniref:Uncharacterized protein n=1 Tax=Triplophysa rosa TaxID=992332 RepID=A0A9W7WDW5_TRIRA|nr:hypothetical protein IRJ41_021707 [Triplophysa rosa]
MSLVCDSTGRVNYTSCEAARTTPLTVNGAARFLRKKINKRICNAKSCGSGVFVSAQRLRGRAGRRVRAAILSMASGDLSLST